MKYLISFAGNSDPFIVSQDRATKQIAKVSEGPLMASIRYLNKKLKGEHFELIVILTEELNNNKDRDYLKDAFEHLKAGAHKKDVVRDASNDNGLFSEQPADFTYSFYPEVPNGEESIGPCDDAVSNDKWVPVIKSVMNSHSTFGEEDKDIYYINSTSGTSQIKSAIRFILNVSDPKKVIGLFSKGRDTVARNVPKIDYSSVKTNDAVVPEDFIFFRNQAASDAISTFLKNYLFDDALEITGPRRLSFLRDGAFVSHLKIACQLMNFRSDDALQSIEGLSENDAFRAMLYDSGVAKRDGSSFESDKLLFFSYLLYLEKLVFEKRNIDFYNSITQFYTDLAKKLAIDKLHLSSIDQNHTYYGCDFLNAIALSKHAKYNWDFLCFGYFVRGIEYEVRNSLQHCENGNEALHNMGIDGLHEELRISELDHFEKDQGDCPFWLFKDGEVSKHCDCQSVLDVMRKMFVIAYGIETELPTLMDITNVILSDGGYDPNKDVKKEPHYPDYKGVENLPALRKYIIPCGSIAPIDVGNRRTSDRQLKELHLINYRFISCGGDYVALDNNYQGNNSNRLIYLTSCGLIRVKTSLTAQENIMKLSTDKGTVVFELTFTRDNWMKAGGEDEIIHDVLSREVLKYVNEHNLLPYSVYVDEPAGTTIRKMDNIAQELSITRTHVLKGRCSDLDSSYRVITGSYKTKNTRYYSFKIMFCESVLCAYDLKRDSDYIKQASHRTYLDELAISGSISHLISENLATVSSKLEVSSPYHISILGDDEYESRKCEKETIKKEKPVEKPLPIKDAAGEKAVSVQANMDNAPMGVRLKTAFDIAIKAGLLTDKSYWKGVNNTSCSVAIFHSDLGEFYGSSKKEAQSNMLKALIERFPLVRFDEIMPLVLSGESLTKELITSHTTPSSEVTTTPQIETEVVAHAETPKEPSKEKKEVYRAKRMPYRPFTERNNYIVQTCLDESWDNIFDALNDYAKNAPDANEYRESADESIVREAIDIIRQDYSKYDGLERVAVVISAMNLLNSLMKGGSGFKDIIGYGIIKNVGVNDMIQIMDDDKGLPVRAFAEISKGMPVIYFEVLGKFQTSFHQPSLKTEDFQRFLKEPEISFDGIARQWCSVTIFCTIKECCDRRLKENQKLEIL